MFEALVTEYRAAGFDEDDAREEAAREVRLTTGDIYFGRSADEIAEMNRQEAEMYAAVADSAGISDEFPGGEFAVPGYNCDFDLDGDWDR